LHPVNELGFTKGNEGNEVDWTCKSDAEPRNATRCDGATACNGSSREQQLAEPSQPSLNGDPPAGMQTGTEGIS